MHSGCALQHAYSCGGCSVVRRKGHGPLKPPAKQPWLAPWFAVTKFQAYKGDCKANWDVCSGAFWLLCRAHRQSFAHLYSYLPIGFQAAELQLVDFNACSYPCLATLGGIRVSSTSSLLLCLSSYSCTCRRAGCHLLRNKKGKEKVEGKIVWAKNP